MGAWLTTTFPVGIVIMCGTIVEWAMWREKVELGPTDYVSGMIVILLVVPTKWSKGIM
jgi:hypothetical protein